MRAIGRLVGATLAAWMLGVGVAAATPSVLPGWPVPSTGTLMPSPGPGGVVVSGFVGTKAYVARYRSTGRLRWITGREPSCGNCFGHQEPALQPDGRYGPIGWSASDFWSVDGDGRIVRPGCAGAMLWDSTCVSGPTGFGIPVHPRFVATRDGMVRWEYVDDDLEGGLVEEDTPILVDGRGIAYLTLGRGVSRLTGAVVRARLLALDTRDGHEVWHDDQGYGVVAAYRRGGVLVRRVSDGALVALDATGRERWESPVPGGVLLDDIHNRLYVNATNGPSYGNETRQVVALDARNGKEQWRTPLRDRARALSVGGSSTLYVAVDRDGRLRSLRALKTSGLTRWGLPTAAPVDAARELGDDTVAVLQGGLLFRVERTRRAVPPRRLSASLSRRTVRSCVLCPFDPSRGVILRLRVPQTADVRVRVRRLDGRPAPSATSDDRDIRVAPGSYWLRLLAYTSSPGRGRRLVVVRVKTARETRVFSLPVTIVQ